MVFHVTIVSDDRLDDELYVEHEDEAEAFKEAYILATTVLNPGSVVAEASPDKPVADDTRGWPLYHRDSQPALYWRAMLAHSLNVGQAFMYPGKFEGGL